MGNIAFLIAFIVIPIIALWRLKSVTWTLVVTFLSVGFVGASAQPASRLSVGISVYASKFQQSSK